LRPNPLVVGNHFNIVEIEHAIIEQLQFGRNTDAKLRDANPIIE
jgi:hypothetical protein